jgi:hypothetical protein
VARAGITNSRIMLSALDKSDVSVVESISAQYPSAAELRLTKIPELLM